jgi:hypothetical protein
MDSYSLAKVMGMAKKCKQLYIHCLARGFAFVLANSTLFKAELILLLLDKNLQTSWLRLTFSYIEFQNTQK